MSVSRRPSGSKTPPPSASVPLPPMPRSAPQTPPSAPSPPAEGTPNFSINTGVKAAAGKSARLRPNRHRQEVVLLVVGATVLAMVGVGVAWWAATTPAEEPMAAAPPPAKAATAATPSKRSEPAPAASAPRKGASESAVDPVSAASPAASEAPPAADSPADGEALFRFQIPPADSPSADVGTTSTPSGANSPLPPAASPPAVTPATTDAPPAVAKSAAEQFAEGLLALHRGQKRLVKKEYPALRALFAERFAREHDSEIRQGLGADYDAMQAWFAEHRAVQETLYTAIEPEADKIPEVLRIFNELRKEFPDKLAPYAELAVATSIVWDEPRRGVYDYGHHARRCKAKLPENLLGALENFKFLVAAEPFMQGRIQYVPWEFLVHVVNHRTPEAERNWAGQNYLNRRVMYGKCYSEVPYDYEMLNSGSDVARLNNLDYTLPNLRQFGGVCAMQADFASRVGKSLGVAAEYVRGESAGNDFHAWVMWVELKQATPTGLVFSLESHGRYRGDKYYVGKLDDPHTGREITDRDLELRLHTVGMDTVAKRQTQLVMAAYPLLCEREQLDTMQRLNFLAGVIGASPGNEPAWYALAQLARECSGQKQYSKQFNTAAERLFATFARFPDFTWKVFDDFAAYQADEKQRAAIFERLVGMYQTADRPDLACEARLKWADLLALQEQPLAAIEGLAVTIKRFPGEGRYVPKMLDRIDLLCTGVPDANVHLARFYAEILPLVPQKRGNDTSPFAIKMFQRAVEVFTRCQQPQLAQAAQMQLTKLQSGQK